MPGPFRRFKTPAQLNEWAAGTAVSHLGIELIEQGEDYIRGCMPVDARTKQPFGLLHGGASCVLAETLGSIGSTLWGMPDRYAVGVDINATHHRAAREGVVTGVATAIHLGRSTACYEVVVSDEGGRRLCTARITCALVPSPKNA